MHKSILFLWIVLALLACDNNAPEESSLLSRTLRSVKAYPDSSGENIRYKVEWASLSEVESFEAFHVWLLNDDFEIPLAVEGKVESSDFKNTENQFWSGELRTRLDNGDFQNHYYLPDSLVEAQLQANRDSLLIIAWAQYKEGTPGVAVQYTLYLRDVFPANSVDLEFLKGPDSLLVSWETPLDLSSLIPLSFNGKIFGYNIQVERLDEGVLGDSIALVAKQGTARKNKWIPDRPTGQILTKDDLIDKASTDSVEYYAYVLEDQEAKQNSFVLRNLKPQTNYLISVEAFDLYGNAESVGGERANFVTQSVTTTSQTAPSLTGDFEVVSKEVPGALVLRWEAASLGSLPAAEYKVLSVESSTQDTLEWIGMVDSTLKEVSPGIYQDTFRVFFPKESYDLILTAIDSTGHESAAKSIQVNLEPLFALECPPGFVATSESTCMQSMEYFDSTGFRTFLRAEEANAICESMTTDGFDVELCGEEQWESNCEMGFDSIPLTHGFSTKDQMLEELLFSECGVAQEDSSNSLSIANRSRLCGQKFGIRDMAGHLQEWVKASDSTKMRNAKTIYSKAVIR